MVARELFFCACVSAKLVARFAWVLNWSLVRSLFVWFNRGAWGWGAGSTDGGHPRRIEGSTGSTGIARDPASHSVHEPLHALNRDDQQAASWRGTNQRRGEALHESAPALLCVKLPRAIDHPAVLPLAAAHAVGHQGCLDRVDRIHSASKAKPSSRARDKKRRSFPLAVDVDTLQSRV
eukprot:3001946-Rhodomonas_salina.1